MQSVRLIPVAAALAACAAHAQTIERMKLTDGELTCVQIYAETHQMDSVIALNANNPAPAPAPIAAAAPAPAQPSTTDPVAAGFASALAGAFGNTAGLAAASGLAPDQAGIPTGVYADPRVQDSIRRARAAGYSDAQIAQMMQLGAARAGYPVAAGASYQMAGMQGAMAAGQAAHAAALAGQSVPAPAAAPVAAAAPAIGGLLGALTGRAGLGGAQAGNLFGAALQGAAAVPAPAPAAAPAPAPARPVAAAPAPSGNTTLAAQARARKEHLTSLFLSKGCKASEMPR